MKIVFQDPKSEYYRGPKTEAPYVLYAEVKGKDIYVDFDTESDFPGALTKAGVGLHNALNPNGKRLTLVPPSKPTNGIH